MTDRSAHASIRGYLFQAWVTVRRWLDLADGERLVCEGAEDIDLVAPDGTLTFEQVKDYSEKLRLSTRSVKRCLSEYVDAFVAAAGEEREARLVITTTAPAEDGFDPDDGEKTKARLLAVLGAGHAGLAALDAGDHWPAFLASITWCFDAPNVDGQRRAIEEALTSRSAAGPVGLLADRLLAEVFRASSRKDPLERTLTPDDRERIVATAANELVAWSAQDGLGRVVRHLRTRDLEDDVVRRLDFGIAEAPSHRPSHLLNARYAVVDFVGREEQLAALAKWRDTERRGGAFLVLGAGGSGKTRLLFELARRSRDHGWIAGFLRSGVSPDEIPALFRGERDRLLVVDYAAGREPIVRKLLQTLDGHEATDGPRVRVVLVAREQGEWWKLLEDDTEFGHVALGAPIRELDSLPADRNSLFDEAAARFAATLDVRILAERPDLAREHFDRILYVQFAALAAVLGETLSDPRELLEAILRHERNHWVRTHRDQFASAADAKTADELTESLLAFATLVGGLTSEAEARAVVPHLVDGSPEDGIVRQALRTLRGQYAPANGDGSIGPLQPDLLGEHLVDGTFRERPEALDVAFSPEHESWWRPALLILDRIAAQPGAKDGDSLLTRVLDRHALRLAETAVEVALESGGPIVAALRALLQRSEASAIADAIERHVPHQTVLLADLAALAADIVLDHAPEVPETDDDKELRALAFGRASNRYHGLGGREKALAAIEEAVALYRALAEARPDAFTPDLATSLNNLGGRLSDLGRREEALAAIEEAVALYRALAEARPDAFTPDFAMSLNNLSGRLSALGRREE
ncbi:MAG: ATP-binding protein, partial [Planctomycetota bacterium JB042]